MSCWLVAPAYLIHLLALAFESLWCVSVLALIRLRAWVSWLAVLVFMVRWVLVLGRRSLICASHGVFLSDLSAIGVAIVRCVLLANYWVPKLLVLIPLTMRVLWCVPTLLGSASSLGRTHYLCVATLPSLFIMGSMYTL